MKQTPVKTLKVSNFLDDFEKDKVKQNVDLVTLFESFGVSLTAKGKSFIGSCPWHEDSKPSLSVDKEKGLYNCFGCGESGDVFTLVEKMKGVSFKEALAYLKTGSFPAYEPKPTVKPVTSSSATPDLGTKSGVMSLDANNLLASIAEFYAKELTTNKEAQAYLEGRKLLNWEVLKRLGVGFARGGADAVSAPVETLAGALSETQKAQLVELGILYESGKEVLAGCIVVPLKDSAGKVVSFYARRITDKDPKHLYLKGSHRGLVNAEALAVYRDEIVLTESVLDGMSLLSIGVQNVLPCYGTNGFTDDHLRALKEAAVKKVVIAFDADEAGTKGAEKLKEKLIGEGFAVAEIAPQGAKDWNQAAVGGLGKEEVERLIRSAEVVVKPVVTTWKYNRGAQRWELTKDGLSYKVVGVGERLGASLRLSARVEKDGKRYLDHVDLYSARSRNNFKEAAGSALGVEAALIEQDLLKLLDQLEETLEEKDEDGEIKMTPQEIELGLSFLKSPTLLDDVVADMEALGHVGEEINKKLVYLAASSRKLDDPVSVVIVSQSAAGKSFLIDTVRSLMPAEEVVNLTSLSDQALNYIPEGGLTHKLLILGEAVHNDVVEHQIREMLSAKELSRMVVSKDEKSGRLESKVVRQKALVSLMMSTTSHEMNPENASRCFFVHADESEEQTKRIHGEQNKKYSIETMKRKKELVPEILRKHHAAQRLLRPVAIVNPFASAKEFPSPLMRSRRDNKQLNELAAAVCFLRQYQKEIKKIDGLEYIECDETDVALAWNLFELAVMKATYLELPESLVRLYEELRTLCEELAKENELSVTEVSFDQLAVRKRVRWLGAESIKKYLKKLVSLEYLSIKSGFVRGQRVKYQLVTNESLFAIAGFENSKSG